MATVPEVTPHTRLKIKKIAVLSDFSKNADTALRPAFHPGKPLAPADYRAFRIFPAPLPNGTSLASRDVSTIK
jgi:hypothetical protein